MKDYPLHKVDKKTFRYINAMEKHEVVKATACGKNPTVVTWAWDATTCKLCLRKEPKNETQ